MATLAEIRKARGVVAELAAANPLIKPVFDRIEAEYQRALAGNESPLEQVARRQKEIRELI